MIEEDNHTNNEEELDLDSLIDTNISQDKNFSWWDYDNEYLSGWQYFGRYCIGLVLCLVVIGVYLLSVTAYKRARSLGFSEIVCKFWALWGLVLPMLFLTPIAFYIAALPNYYLWFSNGSGKPNN